MSYVSRYIARMRGIEHWLRLTAKGRRVCRADRTFAFVVPRSYAALLLSASFAHIFATSPSGSKRFLDATVMMGTLGGIAASLAALLLFRRAASRSGRAFFVRRLAGKSPGVSLKVRRWPRPVGVRSRSILRALPPPSPRPLSQRARGRRAPGAARQQPAPRLLHQAVRLNRA